MGDRWHKEAAELTTFTIRNYENNQFANIAAKRIEAALSAAHEAGRREEREAIGNAGYLFGDQPPTEHEKAEFQHDAGLSHLPTNLTYECRSALCGDGPRAYTWSDKPHRIVFDLCEVIEEAAAIRSKEVKP